MQKVAIIKRIARSYFFLAIAVSFVHLITAGTKGGLGWEAWLVPFMVDGIAIMGWQMRSDEFATRTRRIGFRTQVTAGLLSLAGNVYAAHNAGGVVLGVAVVVLFVFAEWLTDQIESSEAEKVAAAVREAEARKRAAVEKGLATKAAKRRAEDAAGKKVVREAQKLLQ